jgi:hypothetical protein
MRVPWVPLLLGAGLTVAGAWFLTRGWAAMAAGEPNAEGIASLGAGVLLALLGLLMVAVPLLVPVLYRLYGDAAFTTRAAACPVVAKCGRCGEFNFRGRAQCKGCGQGLVWQVAVEA